MATPDDDAKGGSIVPYVVAIMALVLLLVAAVYFLAARDVEEEIAEAGAEVLIKVAEKQRLPDAFAPLAEAAGPWAIEAEVYVPVYSSIYAGQGSLRSNLAATLSIRNTSLAQAIVVREVTYFDSEGKPLRRFVETPHRLGPMATADFFVDSSDVTGGTGANFIVGWAAEAAVSEPLIEVVMIGSIGAKGISFISRGTTVTPPKTSAPATQ